MYSFPNFEPVHFSMSDSNCCFLTCIHVFQKAGKVVWHPHLFKNFTVSRVWKAFSVAFSVVNGVDVVSVVDGFLEFPCFLYDPANVGNLISGSFAFSKSSLNNWVLLVHVC